ncbi:MAG: transporter substrate-binding domain-containing protein, partial [Gammaproteobacteria bacterium]|nr:transporter substrate-binding domain-containing protein [Gammaproteobacteria bacterium]
INFIRITCFPAQSTLSANTENLFSQQENQWLDEHKTLTVGLTEGWPPMSSSNDKSQPQGIDVYIIQLLNSRLGNRLNIEIDEWSKIYTRIKEKKLIL